MRFLFAWQHVEPPTQLTGVDGLRAIVAQLDGFELPARAWERAVLPARVDGYEPSILDMLCLAGEVGWARCLADADRDAAARAARRRSRCFCASIADAWQTLRDAAAENRCRVERSRARARRCCGRAAHRSSTTLRAAAAWTRTNCGRARRRWSRRALVTSDGFAGLRAIVRRERPARAPRDRRAHSPAGGPPLDASHATALTRRCSGRDAPGAGRCCAATASSSAGC